MRGIASFDWATGRPGKTSGRRRMIVLASALFLAAASLAMPLRAYAADSHEIARGKYLVTIGSCTDCHTPGSFFGKPDMSKYLGGSDVGFAIPHLGVFVGPNLTPDKATGLGNWTDTQIVDAITKGQTPQGRMLAPVMPWHGYATLTKSDALAIAAYLKSLPPVSHQVPGPFGPNETPDLFRDGGDTGCGLCEARKSAAASRFAATRAQRKWPRRRRRQKAPHRPRPPQSNCLERADRRSGARVMARRYSPRSLLLLPPASAARVAASKPSTPAMWPIGSYSSMSNG